MPVVSRVGTQTQLVDMMCARARVCVKATSIRKNRSKLAGWRNTDVLIVDEVSMIEPDLFDTLEAIARNIRQNERPFGGMQLILCGE